MAVPGTLANLSLRGIRQELYNNNYNGSNAFTNVSLRNMSTGLNGTINTNNSILSRPNGYAPHYMSEFLNYDHDKAPAGTTPQVSTTNVSWLCKTPEGEIRMTGSVNTSTSGNATTEYGFVWGSSTINPTIGAFGVTKTVMGTSNYNGIYTHFQDGFTILMPCCCNTMDYYVRAYATNAIGTAYGTTVTVSVQDCSCGDGPTGPGGFE